MSDESAGKPFEDGEGPDNRDHGAQGDVFDSVVFDERFVRAAKIHEPSAAERMLAAAQARAESEKPPPDEPRGLGWWSGRGLGRRVAGAEPRDAHEPGYGGFEDDGYASFRDEHDYREYRAYQAFRDSEDTPGYRPGGSTRWHRPVAWVLALVMGVGMVAMAFAAAYRSGSERSEPTPPPATSGFDTGTDDHGAQHPPRPGDPRGSGVPAATSAG